MIAVRLADGSMVYAFSALAVVARNPSGAPDPYWQRAAEASVDDSGDVEDGLMALPGATLIHASVAPMVRPAPRVTPPEVRSAGKRGGKRKGRG